MNLMNSIVEGFLRYDLIGNSRGSRYHHHQDFRLSGTKRLHWANPLPVLEPGQYNSTLCNGKDIPRLTVDGTLAAFVFFLSWLVMTDTTRNRG